jgi:hypothetical protein
MDIHEIIYEIFGYFGYKKKKVKSVESRLIDIPFPPRTFNDGDHLTSLEESYIQRGECPDCYSSLYEGPSGGAAVNVYCSGCSSKYNVMGFMGVDRICDSSLKKEQPKKLEKSFIKRKQ